MKRKEIKETLLELGASPRLLEMPAVMERIYNYYIFHNVEALKREINIGQNGEISCKGIDGKTTRVFREKENGEALFENLDTEGMEMSGKYFIDEFGMDRKFEDYHEPLFEDGCIVYRTKEGTLEIYNGARKRKVEDQGDPILNYNNYTILRKNASRTLGWEGNKDYLTKYYPITKEWFNIREEKMQNNEDKGFER